MTNNEINDMFREIIDILDNLDYYQDYGYSNLYLKLSKMRRVLNDDDDRSDSNE